MAVPGTVPASLLRRALALGADATAALLLGGAFVLAAALPGQDVNPVLLGAGLVLLTALGAVQWWTLATRGWTLGARLVGLRVLRDEDGRAPGAGRALVRLLLPLVAWVVPVLGPALLHMSPAWHPRRRGWHDRAAGVTVLDVVLGADPAVVAASVSARRLDEVLARHAQRPAPSPWQSEPTVPHRVVPHPTGPPAQETAGDRPAPTPPPQEDPVLATDERGRPVTRVVPPAPVQVTTSGPAAAEDVEATRLRPARGRVPELQGAAVTVELTDGRRVRLDGPTLVGRNPAPRPGEGDVALLAVADPGRSVSKTHLVLDVDRAGLWVKDRDSTNGTVVTLADGQQILCGSERPVRLPVGATVAFGDYGLVVLPSED